MSSCSSLDRRRFVQQAVGSTVAASLLTPLAAGAAPAPAPAKGATEWVYVLNSRDASVSLIDKAARTESRRITVGKEPHHLYPTPDGKSLIVVIAVYMLLDMERLERLLDRRFPPGDGLSLSLRIEKALAG